MSSAGANFTLTAKVPAECTITNSHIITNGGSWVVYVDGVKSFYIFGPYKVPLPSGKVEVRQKV